VFDQNLLQFAETLRDHARFFEGIDDVAHEDAHARAYARIVEVPRRQLGVNTVILVTQRIERPSDECEEGGCVDADGQVDRWLRSRFGCMDSAAWQVQHVADLQPQVGRHWERGRGDRCLATHHVRWYIGTVVEMPELGSLNLQDQHVVFVVVGDEAL
jgi:hypothetical protein